jgi:glycogen synthase
MAQDFSWQQSAEIYAKAYYSLLNPSETDDTITEEEG